MTKQQQGFTLIELVVVIVILGILAATALPRFVNLQSDARKAAVDGIAGGLRGAVGLVQAKWLVQGGSGTNPVSMQGANVNVDATTGAPTKAAGGIDVAMQCESATLCQGNAIDLTTTPSEWRPSGVAGTAACYATYAADGSVTTVKTDC